MPSTVTRSATGSYIVSVPKDEVESVERQEASKYGSPVEIKGKDTFFLTENEFARYKRATTKEPIND